MVSDEEVTLAGTARLINGKLTLTDVDSLVSTFRLLLGPLETTGNYNLEADLISLDDTGNDRKRAAKMAACLVRLINEDFGVADLTGELQNSDEEQRNLFTLFAFSILYPIPAELLYRDLYMKFSLVRRYSQSVRINTVR